MSIRIGFAMLFGLALLLGASMPAAAQSDGQQQQSSQQQSQGDNMSGNDQALDENSKEPSQDQSQTTQAEQAQFITRQESSQVLASSIIGMTIQDSTGKKAQQIGTVNDLIMNDQNQVVGVVVGVGGFLGMGEKNVGIPMAAVTNIDAAKDIAVVTVSKKQLQNAPTFTTKQEQKQKQKQKQMQQKMKQRKQEMSSSSLNSDAAASGGEAVRDAGRLLLRSLPVLFTNSATTTALRLWQPGNNPYTHECRPA